MTTSSPYRLPTNVRPQTYNLTLTPDFSRFTFNGEASIKVQVMEATARIVLNAAELQISSAEAVHENGSAFPVKEIATDEKAETVSFTFAQELPVGNATLNIRFTGTLNDQLRGFYRCKYTTLDEDERYLAATQFEATDARRAFPCWDEPAAKASFQVTLEIPSAMTAISNTPVEEETPLSGRTKSVRFAETPKMSTYLLAFVVGDMASVERKTPNGTLVRVWTTRDKEEQGHFALETAVDLLEYFNSYFGIPYPLEKLDHIALPDFAAGAMENWGAITYREIALLFDPENSAANTRQRIAEIVAHEMAHMWFGDLVTMEWWDDLWLNESFASWMGNKAVDHLYPEWDMWTQFVYQDTNGGLSLDGLKNSHPIEVAVTNPAEIGELFDAISYNKGGAVLRMLEEYLGEETFRQGIHDYLGANQYGNARTEDLWASLEKASGKPVTAIMNTWIKQTGYPVLQADTARRGADVTVSLSQRRFLYDLLLGDGETEATKWQIPVSISSADSSIKKSVLMEGQRTQVSLDGPPTSSTDGWIKVNAGQTGFYRVNYSASEWDNLRTAVDSLHLPATDRLGLQNDAFALMRAGLLSPTLFLSLAEGYRNETHASVWSDLAVNLATFEGLILYEPYHSQFQPFARDIFQKAAHRAGWDAKAGEGHLDALLRTTVLGQIGSYGDRHTLEKAKARFDSFLKHPSSLHPDLRDVVFGLTAQEGDGGTFDTLLRLERQAELHEEKMRLLRAMSRFRREDLLRKTLELSLGPDVRTQDTVSLVTSVAANQRGRDMAWEFIKDNWPEFNRRFGGGGFAIMRLVGITGGFTSLDHASDVEGFFQKNPTPSANRTIQQSLERIRLNAKWLEANGKELAGWFSRRA
ncbi:MAG: M1 family metallopeptidase [Chloroflexi bacterium]|nr:M1 family metallopeptidase [Chloroflexota bacterium]